MPSSTTDTNNNEKIRVFARYDMGWHTRGSGYQYDSLSGVGHHIGNQSSKVLEYATRNRKCRMCDKGHVKTDHDCRLNYYGTVKAMEPDVAVELVTRSTTLKEKNIEVGVFIGDNDSSSICAIKKASKHDILKQSDKNHTSKGVKSLLYKIGKIKDPDKELTSGTIKYLHKCFTYAMAQHQGNVAGMGAAIKNIPYHAFNIHDNCGQWCGYVQSKENYEHATVVGGLKNQILFEELKTIFFKLSENAETFVSCASTQGNESLNNTISRKAPKGVPYECSESYDYRVACSIAQKNRGEQYIQDTLKKWSLSPGSHLSKHVERMTKYAKVRAGKAKTPGFKIHRHTLQQNRTQLKNKREAIEGQTYESNIGLFQMPTDTPTLNNEINDQISDKPLAKIIFVLETGGFSMTDDILQIALKYNNSVFNHYVNPTKSINTKASAVHGLTNENSELYLRGVRVQPLPITIVLDKLLNFSNNLSKSCIFVAHNSNFDASRLVSKIQAASLTEQFSKIVIGFSDILSLFKKRFPDKKEKNSLTLTALAQELDNVPVMNAHDALYDVILLDKLISKFFTYNELVENTKSVDYYIRNLDKEKDSKIYIESLNPLMSIVSKTMIRRMAYAAISYDVLLKEYQKDEKSVINLLEQRVDGKPQVIKSKQILNTILNYLKNSSQSVS